MNSTVVLAGLGVVFAGYLARLATNVDARTRARQLRPVDRRLPEPIREPLTLRLARADLALEPEAALRWWVLGVIGVGWFALVLAPPLFVPALLAGVVGGPVTLRLRAGTADRRARAELPAVVDLVVAHLRSGGTVPDAIDALAARPGALAPDFRRIRARLALGATVESALTAWGEERPVPGVRSAAGALAMVTAIGGSAATPLEGLSSSLRNDEAAAGEARALSAQARMSALVVGLAPLAYLAFSTATDPGSSRVLIGTTAGRICLAVGLGLEVLAALWMRALVADPA